MEQLKRSEPNFMCHAIIPKEEVQEAETTELINKVYDGSADKLFAALLGRKKLSPEEIAKLKSDRQRFRSEVMNMSLLQMSVAGAVMIMVITVIRALAINRLPKNDIPDTVGNHDHQAANTIFMSI